MPQDSSSIQINIPQILPKLNISAPIQMLRQLPKKVLSRFWKPRHQRTESADNQDGQGFTSNSLQRNDDWVLKIGQNLDKDTKYDDEAWDNITIYRIPRCLREAACDDNAYSPQIVSLGPYHHGQERLRDMEKHKWGALAKILERNKNKTKRDYLDKVRKLEKKARDCYEELNCDCDAKGSHSNECSDKFVEMMLLDSCFVLEILWGAASSFKKLGYSKHNPVFAMSATMNLIRRDMIKLENQIPLFILDTLFGLQTEDPGQKGVVSNLAIKFFEPLNPFSQAYEGSNGNEWVPPLGSGSSSEPSEVPDELHLLNVFRQKLLETLPRSTEDRFGTQCVIPCVTKLKKEGVTIDRWVYSPLAKFWDIKFENGVLKIPRLLIHNGTKSLFLNLIAYEQCHLDCNNEITAYMKFMDNLIDNPEDVTYLYSRGIIEHWLGSDAEVAELFNRMCQEVVFDRNDVSYLSSVSNKVKMYHGQKWNLWRASLKHKYFNSPWSTISFFAALLLLLLTTLQTFYTMYAYYMSSA